MPGEVAAFRKTGYLMNAGRFHNNHGSTGDLNRGRRTESRVLFGYFLHDAKSNNPFPFREVRGFANLEAAHPNNNFPLTKLNPFETFRGFPNLDSARRNGGFAQTKLNPSPLCGDHGPTFCKAQK